MHMKYTHTQTNTHVRIATHNESINLLARYLQIYTLIYLDVVTKVELKICDQNYQEAHITLRQSSLLSHHYLFRSSTKFGV